MYHFQEVMERYSIEWIEHQLAQQSPELVKQALQQAQMGRGLSPEQTLALLSPQAEAFLEPMAQLGSQLTQQRFGRTIQMYVPLYLSNECLCHCTYCGFSRPNDVVRQTLSVEQALEESQYLHEQGFRHILLLSGEDARFVNAESLKAVVEQIRHLFSSISIEVQPLKVQEYAMLVEAGVDGVAVYQETYDRETYKQVHLAGRKKNYDYRLATPERAGAAGMRRIGIGPLLGLSDWRQEVFYTILHAHFLETQYWRSHISISMPRLKEAIGKESPFYPVSDRHFVQLITAARLSLPNAGLVLSTREPAELRDHLFPLGITQMSAGSKTQTGGYTESNDSGEQFEISDERSPQEVADMIHQRGYDPVWKDWDEGLMLNV